MIKKLLPFLFISAAAISLQAQSNIAIDYGSSATANAFGLKDSSGTNYNTGTAVVAAGYFTATPSGFTAAASTFSNWVTIASSSTFNSASYINTSATVDISGMSGVVGATPYLAVFGGISNIANLNSATEFGLFRSSSWGTVPAGATPPSTPTSFDIRTETFDVIELGTTIAGGGPGTGVGYGSLAAVPEPSTYALLLGVGVIGFTAYRRRKTSKKLAA